MGEERAALRVVRGEPTAEELAVLAALVSVAGAADEPPAPAPRGGWNDPARAMRRPPAPGPGAWRASYR